MDSRIEKLKMLLEVVYDIPLELLDFEVWRDYDRSFYLPSYEKFTALTTNELIDKQVVGCLAGWATSFPYFQTKGLNFHCSYPIFMTGNILSNDELKNLNELDQTMYKGWEAIAHFFELKEDEYKNLFNYENYQSKPVDKEIICQKIEFVISKYS
ncbi:TPA: hypothetical protein MW242_002649 [Acinetobacter baumannii]|nr:hypothetical protein [Acinetobacter baumannii]